MTVYKLRSKLICNYSLVTGRLTARKLKNELVKMIKQKQLPPGLDTISWLSEFRTRDPILTIAQQRYDAFHNLYLATLPTPTGVRLRFL